MPRRFSYHGIDRGLGASQALCLKWLTVTNNQPLTLCSYDNIQVSFRNCWFKASITLRIDRGNTYVYFLIFIQDIYIFIYLEGS